MNITKDSIIGEIVAKDYKSATIFKKYGIDFCCNGNRTIAKACNDNVNEIDKIILELQQPIAATTAGIEFNSWPLDLLVDYIEKKHHRYVENKIVEILPYLAKIVKVHGDKHPELATIEQLFKESAGELSAHMKKEELILFPFIRKMETAKQQGTSVQAPFGTVQNPINAMMHEHDGEGERFRKIAALSDNYTPPSDACNTYKVTFSLLKEFEEDLHLHIHLENNILFPKAILLEQHFKTA